MNNTVPNFFSFKIEYVINVTKQSSKIKFQHIQKVGNEQS